MSPRDLLKAIADLDPNLSLESHTFPGMTHFTVMHGNRGLAYWDNEGEPVENGLMAYCLEEMRQDEPVLGFGIQSQKWAISSETLIGSDAADRRTDTAHEAVYRLYYAWLKAKGGKG